MANSFYDHTTFPVPNAAGTSKSMRDELDAIEQGFDKFPALTASASGLVLKINSGGNAIETSSALSAFSISSSDLTACTLSNTTMSAATINNLGATNISATGTFNISASSGKLINVQIGSAGQTKNIFASAITTNSFTKTTGRLEVQGVSAINAFVFEGNLVSANVNAQISFGGGFNQNNTDISSQDINTRRIRTSATSEATYLTTYTSTGTLTNPFSIDFNAKLITNLATATSTLGATNLSQVSSLTALKFDKAGGIISGTTNFTNNVTFENAVNFSADINLLTNQIGNVGSASSGLQAVNKNQLDNAIAGLVSSAPSLLNTLGEISNSIGGNPDFAGSLISVQATKLTTDGSNAMLGDLNFNSNNGINLATATATHHAVNKSQLDEVDAANLNVTGGSVGAISLTGNINLQGSHNVINAAETTAGTTSSNLSTKQYVDRKSIALQMVYSI